MPEYRKPEGKAVEHKSTKYDGFKLVKTEHPYRHQKGSGRSQIFEFAKDGMLIGTWTKKCAEHGFETKFVIGSLIKLSGTDSPGWIFSEKNDKGQTLDDVKKIRDVDPAKASERAERARAAAEAKKKKREERQKAKEEKAKAQAEKQNAKAKPKARASKAKKAEPKVAATA